jgi:hypothetical protein
MGHLKNPGRILMPAKKRKIGRSAKSGKFMSVAKARKQKSTAVVETIRVGGKKKRAPKK